MNKINQTNSLPSNNKILATMQHKCLLDKHLNFRAPPPSPVASTHKSSFANEDVLSDFLQHSIRVPDLILPDKIFPRQKVIQTPIEIDFGSLALFENSSSFDRIVDSITDTGCFQLVNHGISGHVVGLAAGIFQVLQEKRSGLMRSSDRVYGYHEEAHGEGGGDIISEEFVWCRDEDLNHKMEEIMPFLYSSFREKMESISKDIAKIGSKIISILTNISPEILTLEHENYMPTDSSVCYIYKHNSHDTEGDSWVRSFKNDVIRMLIRGSDHEYELCFHLCHGASEFHVYSKKGWVSFCPSANALIVTVGDQIEAWSNGLYKQVIGRPIFKGENQEDCISMAFLYSSPNNVNYNESPGDEISERTISLRQQTIFALFFAIFYQFIFYIYTMF